MLNSIVLEFVIVTIRLKFGTQFGLRSGPHALLDGNRFAFNYLGWSYRLSSFLS